MTDNPELQELRGRIDEIDDEILAKLHERRQLVGRVAVVKTRLELEPYQPERFKQLIERLQAKAVTMGMEPKFVEDVWSLIHTDSVELQESLSHADAIIE